MSKIDKLIKQLCPDGIVFVELGELGLFENIGVDKKILEGEKKVMLLNFMDVMRNKHIHKNILSMEVSASETKIEKCNIKQFDIFITPTSETRDEIGFTAVADEDIPGAVYSYHVMRYRMYKLNSVTPYFISYLFESEDLRTQIFKASKGLTRFGLSAKDFAKLRIPFPPLKIQEEIVKILDTFTTLEAELEAELEARKKQYTFYRDSLLGFEGKDVEWKTLGEVGEFIRGNGLQKKDFTESGVGCIHYGQIYTHYGTYANKTKTFVSPELAKKLKKASKNDLVIAGVSENVEDVCKAVVWLGDEDICISGDAFIFKHKQNPKFIGYLFQTSMFLEFKKKYAQGAKVTRLQSGSLPKYLIPIPPIEEQERIANSLDKLDTLINNISIGLPAEIKSRRKQYEYYRNQLLTFNRVSNE